MVALTSQMREGQRNGKVPDSAQSAVVPGHVTITLSFRCSSRIRVEFIINRYEISSKLEKAYKASVGKG